MKQKIGVIGVDAGLCWIGDPYYILHKTKGEKPKSIGKDWSEFCKRFKGQHQQFNYDIGHPGLGVLVSTGYGDYPVYAEIQDGRVKSVTVKFF